MSSNRHLRRMGAVALAALAGAMLLRATGSPGPPSEPVAAVHAAADRPAHALPYQQRPRLGPKQVSRVPSGRPAIRVPILMYHYIRVNPDPRDRLGFDLSVTPADFAQQMDWLAANGYHPVDFDDLRGYLLGPGGLPDRPVLLTFDDGYRDLYTTAYPILRAHGFKAVAYVVSGFVNRPENVTAEQILEMDANGIQIGAHTVSHADLTRLSGAGLWHEVYDARVALEALIGHAVVDFCYPSGRVDDAVVQAVQAAGYQTATTTQPGLVHAAADRYQWTRVRVSGGEALGRLVADLGLPEPAEQVAAPAPPPESLHGPPRRPVTSQLLAPPEALAAAWTPSGAALP